VRLGIVHVGQLNSVYGCSLVGGSGSELRDGLHEFRVRHLSDALYTQR